LDLQRRKQMKNDRYLYWGPKFLPRIGPALFVIMVMALANFFVMTDGVHGFSLKTERIKVAGNLYEKPATDSPVVAKLRDKDEVTLIHQNYEWYIVKLSDDRVGWAHESLFLEKASSFKPEKAVPEEKETPTAAEEMASAERLLRVKVRAGRVRESASLESDIKFGLKKGDIVSLIETKGNWHLIKNDGITGWAHKKLFYTLNEDTSADTLKRIEEIQFNITPEGEEKVVFVLNGFYPPDTFVLEENVPKVVCDFSESQLAPGIDQNREVNGSFVRKIRIGDHKGAEPKLRVVLDLVPDRDYEVEQIFFRKENLYTLTFKPAQP